MSTPVELPITGYVDRFSRRPGERMRVHVSVRDGGAYRARLLRVLSADANPKGPGLGFEDLSHHLHQTFDGQRHPIHRGSSADAPAPLLLEKAGYTWTALVCPGLLSKQPQVVLSHESESGSLTLSLTCDGVRAEASTAHGAAVCELAAPLCLRRWYRVWVSADAGTGNLLVGLQPVDPQLGHPTTQRQNVPELRLPSGGHFLVAARNAGAWQNHFDGKIEDPAIVEGNWEWTDPLVSLGELGSSLRAGWDFSVDIPSQAITDVGPRKLHGILRNIPTRAVRGARWSGEEMRWSLRPREYAAIHFHSDDLGDCQWPVGFEFLIPQELRSGAYAFHLSCAAGEDWIPFYVLPPRQGPYARIAFLAPTFTYQAYANDAFRDCDEHGFRERVRDWGSYPYHAHDYPTYGASLYMKHADGSGVALSSRLRPILNMRPGYVTFFEAQGSGALLYPADSHLLGWLESLGFAFDVLTDEDLQEEGAALLAPYATVLTGTHPEYHTMQTLDALKDYTHCGGRLIYLGGNGFYWRIGCQESLPGVIEVRRAEGGIRSWAAEPGEYYHATDGGYGGLWRRNGRDSQALVGVGFSAQGPFEATHFRRTAESYDSQHAWIFEGVEGEILGDYGLSGGGAAGYELDRADVALGTPPDAVILASSEDLPESYYLPLEEVLFFAPAVHGEPYAVNGEPHRSLQRADMVYFETPRGGAVFSVGSITFCGSLWRNGFEGPISRLLENVVRRIASLSKKKAAS